MSEAIVNKVSESSLLTINLEEFLTKDEPIVFDLKDFLFMGLILKEKEYRASLQETNWQQYTAKNVIVTCSADAIVPMWAYMLVAANLQPVAAEIFMGTKEEWKKNRLMSAITSLDVSRYNDQRVVIKGCGNEPLPEAAYLEITKKLRPVAKSIMYGEPCSTVPIYKKPKSTT
jgi:hypothetical protein